MNEARRIEDKIENNSIVKAMKFWPLITSILVLTFALGLSSQTVTELDRKITKESATNDRQEKQIAALEEASKEIVEIKRDIKEILRRLPR